MEIFENMNKAALIIKEYLKGLKDLSKQVLNDEIEKQKEIVDQAKKDCDIFFANSDNKSDYSGLSKKTEKVTKELEKLNELKQKKKLYEQNKDISFYMKELVVFTHKWEEVYNKFLKSKQDCIEKLSDETISEEEREKYYVCLENSNISIKEIENNANNLIHKRHLLPLELKKQVEEVFSSKEAEINQENNIEMNNENVTIEEHQSQRENHEEGIPSNENNNLESSESINQNVAETFTEEVKNVKNKHFANSKLIEKIKNNKGKVALGIVGMMAATALVITNPALLVLVPGAFAVKEFNKGKKM